MLNSETVAFQLDTSKQGYSPDPSSRVGSGVQTRLCSNTDWPVHSLNNTISMLTMNIKYELSVYTCYCKTVTETRQTPEQRKTLLTSIRFETGLQEVEIEKIFIVCFMK